MLLVTWEQSQPPPGYNLPSNLPDAYLHFIMKLLHKSMICLELLVKVHSIRCTDSSLVLSVGSVGAHYVHQYTTMEHVANILEGYYKYTHTFLKCKKHKFWCLHSGSQKKEKQSHLRVTQTALLVGNKANFLTQFLVKTSVMSFLAPLKISVFSQHSNSREGVIHNNTPPCDIRQICQPRSQFAESLPYWWLALPSCVMVEN